MDQIEMTVFATDEAPIQTLGEKIRFQLDFMMLMLLVGRTEEAQSAMGHLRELVNQIE
jgi:hypothetical protein